MERIRLLTHCVIAAKVRSGDLHLDVAFTEILCAHRFGSTIVHPNHGGH